MQPSDEPRDAGMSLAELLVTMTLLGVVTTLLATVVVMGLRVSTTMQQRVDDSGQGEIAVMAASKVLRTAVRRDQVESLRCETCVETAIVRATGNEITLYANIQAAGSGPSLVTLTVMEDPDAPGTGILRQRTQRPTVLGTGQYSYCNPTATGCNAPTRVVARGLLWPAPTAAFSYYDFAGARLTGTTLDLSSISSIDVLFQVRTARGNPPTTAVQRVWLPNADMTDDETT